MANNGIAVSLGLGVGSAQLPYPLLNGFAFSYASVELRFDLPNGPAIFKGVKSANYKAPLEIQKIWGSHPEPYAQTVGKQDYEAEVELYLAEAAAIQSQLGAGFSQIFFNLVCTYSTPGYSMIQDVQIGCRLTSPETSFTMGSVEGITRKYKLNPMSARYGGLALLQNPLAGLLT